MEPSTQIPAIPEDIPAELINGTLLEAEYDAERVFSFLTVFFGEVDKLHPDLAVRDNWKTVLSVRFLLELAAALRILDWEQEGLTSSEMRLPRGSDALHEVLHNMARTDGAASLSLLVGQVFAECFVWDARNKIGGVMTVDAVADEEMVDRIANFLWEHRHDLG